MERTCKKCRLNKAEKELACGYLPLSERSAMVYVPPEFQDLSIRDDVCPVYTYLENVYIYEYLNIAKTMPLHQLSCIGRLVVSTYQNYMSLKKS